MKKTLLAVIMTGLMATNAMAIDGKISGVWIKSVDAIFVYIKDVNDNDIEKVKILVGSQETIKAMYAAVLTAKSVNADVSLIAGTGDNGAGWAQVKLN